MVANTNYAGQDSHPLHGPLNDPSIEVSFMELFKVYSVIDENPTSTPYVFPSGDGSYRIMFGDIPNILTEYGVVVSSNSFANITVDGGVVVNFQLEFFSDVQIQEIDDLAQAKAYNAKQDAISDAATKANAAKDTATADAKVYTDAEIAKIQLLAKKGWGYRRTERLLDETTLVDGKGSAGTLASAVAFGMAADENYVLEVELRDADDKIIYDKEGLLTVATGVDANGEVITEQITVSTEDELFIECVLRNGVPFLRYVKKHDVRVLEMYKELHADTQKRATKVELEEAIAQAKALFLAGINPALLPPA